MVTARACGPTSGTIFPERPQLGGPQAKTGVHSPAVHLPPMKIPRLPEGTALPRAIATKVPRDAEMSGTIC